jgi:hypothetical protein
MRVSGPLVHSCPELERAMRLQRRRFLQISGASVLGTAILHALAPPSRGAGPPARQGPKGKARACIILFQVGGPYQCDTFDPKPAAPEEVRGPFKPIATPVPGVRLTEALPQVARHADQFAIVRSVHHTIRCHNPAIYCSLAGREATDPMAVSSTTDARRTDHPHYASVVAGLRPGDRAMPAHVIVPDVVYNGPAKSPGQLAGYLGAAYDPFVVGADPGAPDFHVEGLGLPEEMDGARFGGRQGLLQRLDGRQRRLEKTGVEALDASYRRAFSLLTSERAKRAFDLGREAPRLRDRYGRHTMGQGALLARRLVEAGVPFVTVFSHTHVEQNSWDTHDRHYEHSATNLLPPADQSFSALLEDLSARGLLDETLVVWMGEFGRTPRMGVMFSNAGNTRVGRDHWCNCYSVVLAGGGVQGGRVVGSSDWIGAYPKERPVHISDLAATIYHALGVDPRARLYDIQGQLRFICDGQPVQELF